MIEKLPNFLLAVFLLSLIPGQLIRINLGFHGAFYLHDFILILFLFSSFIYFLAVRKKFFLPEGSILILIFIIFALVSLINSLRFFTLSQIFFGNLFLIRFILFFLIYLVFFNLVSKKQIDFWFNTIISIGVILAILGFLQLIFFFDLRFLVKFGFDPHFGRLVSTFLDPNFFGGFQVLILNLALAKFLTTGDKKLIFVFIILFTAIILTYSRSSYLALFVSIFLFGILESQKLAIGTFLIFLLLTPIIPRMIDRILGAITLDVTAVARIESWRQAFQIFGASPVLGVGFNNLRFAKAEFGFFEKGLGFGGHAGSGVDSSFLLIAATTGIFGLLAFVGFYFYFVIANFKTFSLNSYSLAAFVSLVGLFFHSQFVNSLFYPWIAVIFWLTIAMSDVSKAPIK